MKRGDLVEIEWEDETSDDWNFFTWEESKDGWVGLYGADDPDTGDEHDNTEELFYVPIDHIRMVTPRPKAKKKAKKGGKRDA